jgi:hypothetical protein
VIDFGETWSSPFYEVRDVNGDLAAAGTVTATITLPDGTSTAPTVANPSTGRYTIDYLTTQAGPHQIVVSATGGVLGSIVRRWTDEFSVSPAALGLVVGLQVVKDHLNMGSSTANDEELRRLIASATSQIEDRIGPVTRRTVVERVRLGLGQRRFWLGQAPVISLTSVTPVSTGASTITVGALDVDPVTGAVSYLDPWRFFQHGVYSVAYVAGRAVVDEGIVNAALAYIRGTWETQRGAAALPLQGSPEERDQPGMGVVMWRLENDLHPFRRGPAVA